MKLGDMKDTIGQMSTAELLEKVREIKNRRVEAPERVKTREKKKQKSSADQLAGLLGISSDDLKSILGD